jgi:hypothetical protein
MTLGEIDNLLQAVLGASSGFTLKDKEAIWESFKVRQAIEENPDALDERLVSLHALLNARKSTRINKIQQLMTKQALEEQAQEDFKYKGLKQANEAFLIQCALAKKANWGCIWKSIKQIDKDSNGYVTLEEFEEIFREWYPVEMEGRTLSRYLKESYGSIANKALIDYKRLRLDINGKLT